MQTLLAIPHLRRLNIQVGDQNLYQKFSSELYATSNKLLAEGIEMLQKPSVSSSIDKMLAALGYNMITEANNKAKAVDSICEFLHQDTCEWINLASNDFSTKISGEIEGFSIIESAAAA